MYTKSLLTTALLAACAAATSHEVVAAPPAHMPPPAAHEVMAPPPMAPPAANVHKQEPPAMVHTPPMAPPAAATHAAMPPPAACDVGKAAQGLTVHLVAVGDNNGSLKYFPDTVHANPGDVVQFQFHPKNHTVTESTFDEPCKAKDPSLATPERPGLRSGFVPVTGQEDTTPVYNVLVNDTMPIWIFCGQMPHCMKGMSMVINPPADPTRQIKQYQEAAAALPMPPAAGGAPPAGAAPPAGGAAASGSAPPAAGASGIGAASPPSASAGGAAEPPAAAGGADSTPATPAAAGAASSGADSAPATFTGAASKTSSFGLGALFLGVVALL